MAGEYEALTEAQKRLVLLYIIDREILQGHERNLVKPGFIEAEKNEAAHRFDEIKVCEDEIRVRLAGIPGPTNWLNNPQLFLDDLETIFREIDARNAPQPPTDTPIWEMDPRAHALPPDVPPPGSVVLPTPPPTQMGGVAATPVIPPGMTLKQFIMQRMGLFNELAADDGHESAARRGGGDGSNLDSGSNTRGR